MKVLVACVPAHGESNVYTSRDILTLRFFFVVVVYFLADGKSTYRTRLSIHKFGHKSWNCCAVFVCSLLELVFLGFVSAQFLNHCGAHLFRDT